MVASEDSIVDCDDDESESESESESEVTAVVVVVADLANRPVVIKSADPQLL